MLSLLSMDSKFDWQAPLRHCSFISRFGLLLPARSSKRGQRGLYLVLPSPAERSHADQWAGGPIGEAAHALQAGPQWCGGHHWEEMAVCGIQQLHRTRLRILTLTLQGRLTLYSKYRWKSGNLDVDLISLASDAIFWLHEVVWPFTVYTGWNLGI